MRHAAGELPLLEACFAPRQHSGMSVLRARRHAICGVIYLRATLLPRAMRYV